MSTNHRPIPPRTFRTNEKNHSLRCGILRAHPSNPGQESALQHQAPRRADPRHAEQGSPSGLAVVNIAAGVLEGMQMLLDMQTEKDFWLGTYEPEMQFALRELINRA